ncbi:MAG: ankyrin repeat domain-containing protein [Candidatus Thiodiazotropha sp. 6PLUC2]
MSSVNPKLLIALVVVILFAVFLKVSNPHRKYSTQGFWETATIASIDEVPDEALEPGNRNGGVLMWAAMVVRDPEIIEALVSRGAEINEADGIFMGTPLTGAAGYSSTPEVIDKLIELGADISQLVNNNEDALMIAARYNHNPAIIEKLLEHGADMSRKNSQDLTAADIARESGNKAALTVFEHPQKL